MLWVRAGSVMMFIGILLGAFGAHALRHKLPAENFEIFKTAVFYHLIHALALFIVAWLSTQVPSSKVSMAGAFIFAGIILFSGSLYALSITNIRGLGAITPLGGIAFLIGWSLLCLIPIQT